MQVFLLDEHKYHELEPINEMLVKRGGVRMNPEPKFMISGLTADEEYFINLRVELADEFRYTFQNDQWIPLTSANKNANLSKMSQVESRREAGSTWHIVQFDQLRITRELSEIRKNLIYVEPNHKYSPILSIINVSTGVSVDFCFDQLTFMAVKSYQSITIRHAKRTSSRNVNLLGPRVSTKENEENKLKSKSVLPSKLIESSPHSRVIRQLYPSYLYGYTNGIGDTNAPYHSYHFDYWLLYPHLQYPIHQIPYSLPTLQLQYPETNNSTNQHSIQDQYVPEYGWNSILVPGCRNEEIEDPHNILGIHHKIWAPQEMELENLYFQTEQNYQPLEMN